MSTLPPASADLYDAGHVDHATDLDRLAGDAIRHLIRTLVRPGTVRTRATAVHRCASVLRSLGVES